MRHECGKCSGTGRVSDGRAERAELIRVQCELARADDTGQCPRCRVAWSPLKKDFLPLLAACLKCGREGGLWKDAQAAAERESSLRARESALLTAHGREWSRPVTEALGGRDFVYQQGGWFTPRYHRPESMLCWRFVRGLIGVVRVPTLAELVGDRACPRCYRRPHLSDPLADGPCPACAGLGRVRECPGCGGEQRRRAMAAHSPDCPSCSGRGTLPPLAPAIGRAAPGLAAVEAADREPNDYGPPEDGCRFGWLSEVEHGAGPAGLPQLVLKRLPASGQKYPGRWPTRADALAALSAALVRVCREAGHTATQTPAGVAPTP